MSYRSDTDEVYRIIAFAMREGTEMLHPLSGLDHAFYSMLKLSHDSACVVLAEYESRATDIRELVNRMTVKRFFKKRHGLVIQAGTTPELRSVAATASARVRITGRPDLGGLMFLEEMLLLNEPGTPDGQPSHLERVLNSLEIDRNGLLERVQGLIKERPVGVTN